MDLNEISKNICIIHEYTKKLTLLGEEFGKDFLGFYQPIKELKDAYEHIIRAKSQELGLRVLDSATGLSAEDYILSNYRKALSHEYRAFFDTADFLSVTIRGKIIQALNSYPISAIKVAIPEYYSEHRTRIDAITYEIAEYRSIKDIGKLGITLPTVEKYANACEELINIYRNISKKEKALIEVSERETEEKRAERKRDLKVKIIIAGSSLLVGTVIGIIIKILFKF